MKRRLASAHLVAIACGGTGGHLFPGLAVAEALEERGCDVLLMVSSKAVDQQAVRPRPGLEIITLPAVGLQPGRTGAFLRGFWQSYRMARRHFQARPPGAVLAMGGFTGAPPILAGRACGALTFLHEANVIPGRANRWLAHFTQQAFVYFEDAASRLWQQRILCTGMPVRSQFAPLDPPASRLALGLHPKKPVLLITGGSQGARALNDLLLRVLPSLRLLEPALQYVHLTGPDDLQRVRQAYANLEQKALVLPFLTEMELALSAATLALGRAGASFLAELAAVRLPALLVPYPIAADNHQFHNGAAFVQSGAARMQEQAKATPESLLWEIRGLLKSDCERQLMRVALARWHFPEAARTIARSILELLPAESRPGTAERGAERPPAGSSALSTLKPETRI